MPILKTLRKFWTGDTQNRELRLVRRAQLKTISDGDGLLYVWSGDIHLREQVEHLARQLRPFLAYMDQDLADTIMVTPMILDIEGNEYPDRDNQNDFLALSPRENAQLRDILFQVAASLDD